MFPGTGENENFFGEAPAQAIGGFFDVLRVVLEVLGDQPPVAVVGGVLAARGSDGPPGEIPRAELFLDLPLTHQAKEACLVLIPRHLLPLLELVEDVLGGSEQRRVLIIGSGDLAQEVREIVPLGEAGELRAVVEPDVEQALDFPSVAFSVVGPGPYTVVDDRGALLAVYEPGARP